MAKSMKIGSQKLIQHAVNDQPNILANSLRRVGALDASESVSWRSPIRDDKFREYRDDSALEKISLKGRLRVPLNGFWPKRGCVWDALGVTSTGRPLLVEAKAHIPEVASPPSKAIAKASVDLIRRSLSDARRFYSPRSRADWSGTFYQYANRLAYHYFLTKRNGIQSRLVFLHFTNAIDMVGPATEQEWHGAMRLVHCILGLPADLSRMGVFHAYIDVKQFGLRYRQPRAPLKTAQDC